MICHWKLDRLSFYSLEIGLPDKKIQTLFTYKKILKHPVKLFNKL
jgi:hypothetical protein